jgi:hypothetical protein
MSKQGRSRSPRPRACRRGRPWGSPPPDASRPRRGKAPAPRPRRRPMEGRHHPMRAPPVEGTVRRGKGPVEIRGRRQVRVVRYRRECQPHLLQGRESACPACLSFLVRGQMPRGAVHDDLEALGPTGGPRRPGPARRCRASRRGASAPSRCRRIPPSDRRRKRRCDGQAPHRRLGGETPDEGRQAARATACFGTASTAVSPRWPSKRAFGSPLKRTISALSRVPSASRTPAHRPPCVSICCTFAPKRNRAPRASASRCIAAARRCIPPSTAQTPRASECQMSPRIAGLR